MKHLFDTHFHLDLQKNQIEIIQEIEKSQIYTIAVTNLPELYLRGSSKIASKYIKFALGFHPELIHDYYSQIPLMWDLLPDARYIGEVGLDGSDRNSKIQQIIFFKELIERCRDDNSKIISIHTRGMTKDVLNIIGDNFKFKPILHWFSGTKENLFLAIDRGFYFSINSSMIKSQKFLTLMNYIPNDRILIETDSPFIRLNKSYSQSLNELFETVENFTGGVDLWNNFKSLLI